VPTLDVLSVLIKLQHYLRGENGIHYEDLYHLVKFLPSYHFPAGMPSMINLPDESVDADTTLRHTPAAGSSLVTSEEKSTFAPHLPLQAPPLTGRHSSSSTAHRAIAPSAAPKKPRIKTGDFHAPSLPASPRSARFSAAGRAERGAMSLGEVDDEMLAPARRPPKWSIFDLFPFSLFIMMRTRQGKETEGRKAAKMKAKLHGKHQSHNIPLEISLYLVSTAYLPESGLLLKLWAEFLRRCSAAA
jgi:putative membrane protein